MQESRSPICILPLNRSTLLDIALLQLTCNQSAQLTKVQHLEEVKVCRLSAALDSAHHLALGLILLGYYVPLESGGGATATAAAVEGGGAGGKEVRRQEG